MPPKPGSFCKVCRHPLRVEIDEAIRRGVLSNRRIAADYGLKHWNVSRHAAAGHVAPPPNGGKLPPPSYDLPDPRDGSPLATLKRTLHALQQMDVTEMSNGVMLGHSDAIRRTAEAIAKLEPAQSRVVSINDVAGLPQFIGILFEELEPHPELRERIASRLSEIDGAEPMVRRAAP